MERFSFRRFLNTLGGRLAGLALFLDLFIAIIGGGTVGGLQLLRIRDAATAMQEASTHIEMALTTSQQVADLVLRVRDGMSRGLTAEEMARETAAPLVFLDSQQQALRTEARRFPEGSELRVRMETAAIVLTNVTGTTRQILQAPGGRGSDLGKVPFGPAGRELSAGAAGDG
jgi:hypothetical protein